MTASKTRPAKAPVYVPIGNELDGQAIGAPRGGRRRETVPRAARHLRWPTTMIERRKVVQLWRRIAMGILTAEDCSFRLVAVVPDCMIWTTGEIWSTNDRLAMEGGGCSRKTIQRDVKTYRLLGLFKVAYGWKRNDKGELAKTRTIRLAIPDDFTGLRPPEFTHDHLDHACPHGDGHHPDHVCPQGLDHGCPIIVEHSEEGDGDAA